MSTLVFITLTLSPCLSQTPQELAEQVQQKYKSFDNLTIEATFEKLYNGKIVREGTYFTAMDRNKNFIHQYNDTKRKSKYTYWKYDTEEEGLFTRDYGNEPAFTEQINIEEGLSALTGGTSHTGIDIPLLFYAYHNNAFALADSLILHPSEIVEKEDCFILEMIQVYRKTYQERQEIKMRMDSIALEKLGFIPETNSFPSETTTFKNKWWIRKKDYMILKREEVVINDRDLKSSISTEWLTVKENSNINIKNYISKAQENKK